MKITQNIMLRRLECTETTNHQNTHTIFLLWLPHTYCSITPTARIQNHLQNSATNSNQHWHIYNHHSHLNTLPAELPLETPPLPYLPLFRHQHQSPRNQQLLSTNNILPLTTHKTSKYYPSISLLSCNAMKFTYDRPFIARDPHLHQVFYHSIY